MAEAEKILKPEDDYVEVVVKAGHNPEGRPYFRKIKVSKRLPTVDELPPTDKPLFKTKSNAKKYATQQKVNEMEEAWTRATSRKGRPPIGGAQDD